METKETLVDSTGTSAAIRAGLVVYNVNGSDYLSYDDAHCAAIAAREANLITFCYQKNMPFCSPDFVAKCVGLELYKYGEKVEFSPNTCTFNCN